MAPTRIEPGSVALKNISLEVMCDVSWSLWLHQQPSAAAAAGACPDGDSVVCVSGTTAPPLCRPPELVQQHEAASLSSSFYRRRLSIQACDMLDVLTTLYKSKLVSSRRLFLRRSLDIDVTAVTGVQEARDTDRENRLQQIAVRVSDLVSGFVLFARELPGVAQLPLTAKMALVKACAPTFILVRAAELYDEGQAALVDELGDVVPMAIIDDLLSEIRREPGDELSKAAASRCRRFFEVVSTVKRQLPSSGPGGSSDVTAIALLQAIALHSPELVPPDIVSQDALEALANAQQRLVFLLRQHLEATCSFEDAASAWPNLLSTLEACKHDAAYVTDLLLSCDAVRRDGLLAEILDGRSAVNAAMFSSDTCASGESPALPHPWTVAGSEAVLPLPIVNDANEQELGSLFSTYTSGDSAQSFSGFAGDFTGF